MPQDAGTGLGEREAPVRDDGLVSPSTEEASAEAGTTLDRETQKGAAHVRGGTGHASRLGGFTVHGAPLAYCLSWSLAGAVLLNWSVQLLGFVTVYPPLALLVIGAGAWGLGAVVLPWLGVAWPARWRWLGEAAAWTTAVLVVGCYAAWAVLQVRTSPGYGTDEIAFNQYAGLLASHGLDPYTRSMLPSFALYKVSPDGFTYHLNGTPVTSLSYPALAFLAYVPFLLLGWSTQVAIALNAAAWAAAVLLLFALLPRELRALGLALGSVAAYGSYAIGGVTDMLYVPLLVGAAYGWTAFARRQGWRRYVGPVLLGLAMCVKQTPWVDAPFLLAGIFMEARAASGLGYAVRSAAKYVAAAAAAFFVPNLPYIALGPSAWLRGVLTPLVAGTVPAGQGLIGLTLFLRLGGGSIEAYSLLSIVVLVVLLAFYVLSYPLLRPATFLLASLVLFFATRSFGSYLVSLVPVMVIAAVTTERAEGHYGRAGREAYRLHLPKWSATRLRKAALAGTALVLPIAVALLALLSPPPTKLTITGARTTGQLATVEQVSVNVANRSGQPLHPHFTIDEGGAVTTFWQVASGPATISPHSSASYVLQAPNFPAQPSIGGGFQVMAFTTRPATVSASAPYVPETEHVALVPEAINNPVPIGTKVVVRAELLDQFDQPVQEAGVPVYLGQIIYDQTGLIYSEAVINGSPPGQTPVAAYTNAQGVATFDIVGTQVTQDPVYFEANLVSPTEYYPYGYSQILAIRFEGAR
ncbi:MAG: hypothetical protein ACP5VR_12160 [Acidimicrobiales bacterium]